MFTDLADAAYQVFAFQHLFYLMVGVVFGLAVGIIPGLGGSAGLALTLPFVIGVEPGAAIGMMIGLQSVTATSDTFPAVLVGVPGTASAQATVVDGFEMAKKGRAAEALSAAFTSSLIGGLFGAIVLTVAIGFAEPVILAFGLAEQMMLVVLAVALIGALTGNNVFKGLAAASLGMLIGTIGSAPTTAVPRFTFDSLYLLDPIKVVLIGLGLFAVPEILGVLCQQERISQGKLASGGWTKGFRAAISNFWLIIRCSAIGSALGALPGLGGSVIDWIAYAHAKQSVKNPETLGTGDVRGVIAPEAANNAKEGGALIPTLLFGIPGSGSMALLLGGFILVGIEPGINMVRNDTDIVYLMVWSVALANIIGASLCFGLAALISRLTAVKFSLLAPVLLVIICFAAYQATKDIGDLVTVLIIGLLGVLMKRHGWSRPALLIGFVLAPRLEASVYQTVTVYGWSAFSRPIVLFLALVVAVILIRAVVNNLRKTKSDVVTSASVGQILMVVAFIAFGLWTFVGSLSFDRLTGFFPLIASATFLALLFALIATHLFVPGFSLWEDHEPPAASGEATPVMNFTGSLTLFVTIVVAVALVGILPVALLGVGAFLLFVSGESLLKTALICLGLTGFLFGLNQALNVALPVGLVTGY
jgi:putative tricarboxylic transport membrane protein